MATAFVLGPQGYTVTLVLRVWVSLWQFDLVLSHCSEEEERQTRAVAL